MNINEYINMVLYNKRTIQENIQTISISQAENYMRRYPNVRLVDVRSPQEYAEGHRIDAILIPSYEMEVKADRILRNKDEIIILYCATGARSKRSASILQNMGYRNVYVLEQE